MPANKVSSNRSSKKGLIAFVVLVLLLMVGGYYAYSQGKLDNLKKLALSKMGMVAEVEQPKLDAKLGQTVTVSPSREEVIRMVDKNGVLIAVKIPKGAVEEETEISVVALEPKEDSVAPTAGVMITPASLKFLEPVMLSFNYAFTEDQVDVEGKNGGVYRVGKNLEKEDMLQPELVMQAVVGKNYLPIQIDSGGAYVWDLVGEDRLYWAKEILATKKMGERDVLAAAMVYVNRSKKWSSEEEKVINRAVRSVMTEEEPNLHLLYAAKLIQDANEKLSWIPQAQAENIFDDYLQFRCNLPESDYEDLVAAMMLAGEYGNDELQETCREKAEEKIVAEAEALLVDKNSTVAQLVEVGEQMDIIGADSTERGAAAKEQISEEFEKAVEKAVEEANKEAGIEYEDDPDNDDARERGTYQSRDMSTTLPQELLGVGLAQAVGINSWDEAGLKKWAAEAHQQVGALGQMAAGMCELMRTDPLFGGIPPEAAEECAYLESGAINRDLEKWEDEVGEVGEFIGEVQRGMVSSSSGNFEDRDSGYEIDNYGNQGGGGLESHEVSWDKNGDGSLSDEEYDAMMDDYYQDDYYGDDSNWDNDGDGELSDDEWNAMQDEWEEHEESWGN